MVSGSHWGQVAVNHLRERVNMTHVVLSIPAVLIASLIVGVPLNKWLGGTRTALQRIIIALTSVPATVVLAVVLFSFNATFPDAYAALLRFADWVWQGSLNALSAAGDTIPGALKLTNVARQGFSGHHYVIMALCSMVASFLVNAIFALAIDTRRDEPRPHQVGLRQKRSADRTERPERVVSLQKLQASTIFKSIRPVVMDSRRSLSRTRSGAGMRSEKENGQHGCLV